MLIYKALYRPFKIFCRPLSMCCEEVDKTNHMFITQKYRLEPWTEEENIYGKK